MNTLLNIASILAGLATVCAVTYHLDGTIVHAIVGIGAIFASIHMTVAMVLLSLKLHSRAK